MANNRFLNAAIGLFCACFLALAQSGIPFSQSFTFGMVGVTADQVARLNVVNSAPGPAGQSSCTIDLTFLDSDGKILKTARSALGPQKAAQLDLERRDVPDAVGRIQIRAGIAETVSPSGGLISAGSACAPVTTLEVFDNDTGKTSFILTDPKMVPLGAPPPGGAVVPGLRR